jgi:tRNA dimethylallyltransferase
VSQHGPAGVAIVGATATGKTALAIAVARSLEGEIIGVDSRQAYRGMSVGTAAPHPTELGSVAHHGVEILDPTEEYGAGTFARWAWMEEIRSRGRLPILCGGTGFFLRALLQPVFAEPDLDPGCRQALRSWLDEHSAEDLRRWAGLLDPEWTRGRDIVDRQRAARAIELALLTGHRLSWWQDRRGPDVKPLALLSFGLRLPPEEHRERIRRRAHEQLAAGWPEEVEALRAAGVPADAPALDAVGYREVADLLDGKLSREDAAEAIARQTWQYARRQRTWFRHQLSDLHWLDATESREHLAGLVEREWRRR